MKIEELEKDTKVINLVSTVAQLDEKKETPNGVDYTNGVLEDETGQVKITFWNEDATKYKEGDKILMSTGWCKEFQNELQVSAGKFGKISLVPAIPEEAEQKDD